MTWWRIEIETGEEDGGPVPEPVWKTEVVMSTRDPRVASAALCAVVDGLDTEADRAQPDGNTVAVTADSAMDGLVGGLRKEVEELKVIRDQLAEDRDVLKIRLAEAHRAAVVHTGGKPPYGRLSPPVSAETPFRAPREAVQGPAGPQNRSESDAGAVLRVVLAARAWRERIVDPPNAWADDEDLDLIGAVDALGDTPASVIPGTNWMTTARGIGWRNGVRWAAAEADTQYAEFQMSSVLDIADHLRLCAADPARPTVVGRDQAPKERP